MPTRYITVHCYTKQINETTLLHQLPLGRQECQWYEKSSLGEKFHKAWYSQHLQDRRLDGFSSFSLAIYTGLPGTDNMDTVKYSQTL